MGKTEMGESLEPLAEGEELVRILSSGILVLFTLSLYLCAGHARNCQYITAFIQHIFYLLSFYLLPRIKDSRDTALGTQW